MRQGRGGEAGVILEALDARIREAGRGREAHLRAEWEEEEEEMEW